MKPPHRLSGIMLYGNALIAFAIATWFFFIPGILVVRNLCDPAIRTGDIPREAWRLHRYLSPRCEQWASGRVASGKAAEVHYLNVTGTEWPPMSAVFFLQATENLQAAWEKDNSLARFAPADSARGAIEACKNLILDPAHHGFVKEHWGENYMHNNNLFFRSMLIAGLSSYERLTGSGEYLPMLREQINSLVEELDASPLGLLYDYPGECYPLDVYAAVAWIKKADEVAGTDHSAFIQRERRAFEGARFDENGLVPWLVDPNTGHQFVASRGLSNSYVLSFAHNLYPDLSQELYSKFEEHFWQKKWFGEGFRECYPHWPNAEWAQDVDAGFILGGFSTAGSAFGIGAARGMGRLDHGYTLMAQALAVSIPMLDGSLMAPRFISDSEHAPYMGEISLLRQYTVTPAAGADIVKGGSLAGSVYIALAVYFGGSLPEYFYLYLRIRKHRKRKCTGRYRVIRAQFYVWIILLPLSILLLSFSKFIPGIIALSVAQFAPVLYKKGD